MSDEKKELASKFTDMAAIYGSIGSFNCETDDWIDYAERVEHYFYANEIKDEKKKTSIFLKLVGNSKYSLVKSLIAPEKPSNKYFTRLREVLQKQLRPDPIEIAERFKFYRRDQLAAEKLAEYLTNLRKFAETCGFKTFLDEALRDRYVCGMRSDAIRKRLLIEKDLTLAKANEVSQCMDMVRAEVIHQKDKS